MKINTSTGDALIFALPNIGGLPGLAIDSQGKMYGATAPGGELVLIDAGNGSSRDIGALHVGVKALAFDSSDVLYASDGEALYTFNTSTAARTLVGSHGITTQIRGLAFDPAAGILYASSAGDGDKVYTIDKTTGAATLLGTIGVGPEDTTDLCVVSGVLYGVKSGADDPTNDLFLSINTSNGAGTSIGTTGVDGISGLASWKSP
jgi:DNA-binding beta-propeller fold protein YncE